MVSGTTPEMLFWLSEGVMVSSTTLGVLYRTMAGRLSHFDSLPE